MNADGKIYIVITDKLPGSAPGPSPVPTTPSDTNKEGGNDSNSLFAHWARQRLIDSIKSTAMSAVRYTISNIGNFTGDYIAQTHVNDSIANLNGFKSVGLSILAGAKYGGPIGAVVGGALGIINQTTSSLLQMHSQWVQNSKVNYEIAQLRDRVGMNATIDGSRGTEN